jgi:hypothetical protein
MLNDLMEMVNFAFDREVEAPVAVHARLPEIDAALVVFFLEWSEG